MPAPEVDTLYQSALYWPFAGLDANGQPMHGAPIQLQTRFTWTRREAKRPDGTNVTLDAQAIVTKVIPIDSLFWVDPRPALQRQYVSSLAYFTGTGSGVPDSERMIVVTFESSPDIKARFYHRTIGLMRHHSGGGATV